MTMAVDIIMVKVRTTIQRQTKFDESYVEKIGGVKSNRALDPKALFPYLIG